MAIKSAVEQVRREPMPTAQDVYRDTYTPSSVDAIYPEDYFGRPN
jgi:hypothetical protein